MKIAPIKTEKDYQKALTELEKVFDSKPNSPEGDLGQMLVLLIEDFEKKHYPIGPPVQNEQELISVSSMYTFCQ